MSLGGEYSVVSSKFFFLTVQFGDELISSRSLYLLIERILTQFCQGW